MSTKFESFIDRHQGGERVILVHIDFSQPDAEALTEAIELINSSDLDVIDVVRARKSKPDPKYFVGRGKMEEIAALVAAQQADVVLFNHDLAPRQGRNLECHFKCRVVDRTELILYLFAAHARSFEGKLQVELAQCEHLKSCLVRGWTHLERQKGGIGLRGPGETQLETDRRLLMMRIKALKKRLDKVESQRHQSRKARVKAMLPSVSLVGYTNAGKSTLFNRITSSDVYVADQLFATLDPTFRHITLQGLGKVIVADTVGFIRNLPHDLVAAFRATLDEVRYANILLHVVDVHHPDRSMLIESVDRVINELGATNIPTLMVYNKIDLESHYEPRIDYHENGMPKRVWLSAKTGEGCDLLFQAIAKLLEAMVISFSVTLEPEQGALRAKLYDLDAVVSEVSGDDGKQILDLTMRREDACKLLKDQMK